MDELNVREAVAALQPLVRGFKTAVYLSDALTSLVGIEDHRNELVAQVERLKKDVTDAKLSVSAAEAETIRLCAAAREKADALIKEALDRADEYRLKITEEAQAHLDTVNADLATILAAKEQAASVLEEIDAEVAKQVMLRDTLTNEISGLKARLLNIVQ